MPSLGAYHMVTGWWLYPLLQAVNKMCSNFTELSYWVFCIFHTNNNSVKNQTPSRKNETVLSQEVCLKKSVNFNIILIEKTHLSSR